MTQNFYNASQAYKRAGENISGIQTILSIYDSIIACILQAKEAITKNDIETRYNCLTKACTALLALRNVLDFDNSPDVATALDSFYDIMDRRLLEVQFNDDPSICDEVIRNIKRVRSTWAIMEEMQIKNAPTSIQQSSSTPANLSQNQPSLMISA